MTQPVELRERLRQRTRTSTNKSPVTKSVTPEQKLLWVQIALTFLPLITAFIYLLGMSWHMGYLGVFNVDSSEFPLSTEMTLLTGIISLTSKLAPFLGYPVAAVVVFVVIWGIFALTFELLERLGNKIQTYTTRIGDSEVFQRALHSVFRYSIRPHQADSWGRILERVFGWYLIFAAVVVICSAVFFLAYYSYLNGRDVAQSQIEKITQGTFAEANQLRYAKHPEGISALRIVCNATECTFWTPADGTIFLRHEKIEGVEIPTEGKKAETLSSWASIPDCLVYPPPPKHIGR
jgi:hypothetical protein